MPIYAYRCGACGFRKDVLQKMSDPALSVCPTCGAESFAKQLSAPAFQLKGTGWYATDFKDKAKKPEPVEGAAAAPAEAGAGAGNGSDKGSDKGEAAKPSDGKKADGKGAPSDGGAAPAPAVAPPVKPAAKEGGSSGAAGTTSGGSGAS